MKITVTVKGNVSRETLTNACLIYLQNKEVREVIFDESKKVQNQLP